MGYVIYNTGYYYTYNGDLSSFSCVNQNSLVRSDDAVKSVECHAEDKESTREKSREQDEHENSAVPKLVWREKCIVFHRKILAKTCQVNIGR